jgi:hypothetical protein
MLEGFTSRKQILIKGKSISYTGRDGNYWNYHLKLLHKGLMIILYHKLTLLYPDFSDN